MNGCDLRHITMNNLWDKVANGINTIVALESQGYFVNECKFTKLNNATMLAHSLESDFIISHEQKHKLAITIDKFLRQ